MVGFGVEPAAGRSSRGTDEEMERGVQGVLWGGEGAASLRGLGRMLAGYVRVLSFVPLLSQKGV